MANFTFLDTLYTAAIKVHPSPSLDARTSPAHHWITTELSLMRLHLRHDYIHDISILRVIILQRWSGSSFGEHQHLKRGATRLQGAHIAVFSPVQMLVRSEISVRASRPPDTCMWPRQSREANSIILWILHGAAKRQSYFSSCNYLEQRYLT